LTTHHFHAVQLVAVHGGGEAQHRTRAVAVDDIDRRAHLAAGIGLAGVPVQALASAGLDPPPQQFERKQQPGTDEGEGARVRARLDLGRQGRRGARTCIRLGHDRRRFGLRRSSEPGLLSAGLGQRVDCCRRHRRQPLHLGLGRLVEFRLRQGLHRGLQQRVGPGVVFDRSPRRIRGIDGRLGVDASDGRQ
jgi:hypothetical protein